MLDFLLTPTPLMRPGEQPPVPLIVGPMHAPHKTWHVMRAFGGFLWGVMKRRVMRRADVAVTAAELRATIEELGGLWIKLGQLLSLRSDVIDPAICAELGKLQYRAVGFPFEVARAAIEKELGAPLDQLFSRFDEDPIAAASVSQVHRACLRRDGVEVIVKVLRPNAPEVFHRDLKHISGLIWVIERLNFAPHVHWRKGLEALAAMVVEEIDFRFEAANTRRMRKSLKNHKVYVPKVFIEYCTAGVLVAEFVEGVLMSDYIRVGAADPQRTSDWCRENAVDPEKLARKLFMSAVRQFLEDNLFHADLHPGNIILLRENRFALIDFGTIGSCDRSFLLTYKASLAAMAEKDFLRAADMTLRLAIKPPGPGILEQLRQEIVASYRHWEARTHLQGVEYHERSLAAAGNESGRIMFKYKVQLTWEFMRISRTWSTLDASLSFLIPQASYLSLFRKYFKAAQRRNMQPRRLLSTIVGSVRRTYATLEEYQDMLGPIARKQAILRPSFINAGERLLRFARTYFRLFANVILIIAIVAGLMELDHYHPDLFRFENHVLHELADENLTGEEIWWMSLAAAVIVGFIIRRSLRSVDKDPQ
jgi:ubiquinone biosynthesis protein